MEKLFQFKEEKTFEGVYIWGFYGGYITNKLFIPNILLEDSTLHIKEWAKDRIKEALTFKINQDIGLKSYRTVREATRRTTFLIQQKENLRDKIEQDIISKDPKRINRNLKIFKNLKSKKDIISLLRKWLAIYRMYRYIDLSPEEISRLTNTSLTRIHRWIGEAFEYVCLNDDFCWAKPLLEGKIDNEPR